MHRHRRWLLTLALLLAMGGVAFAQSMGLGLGVHELRGRPGSGSAVATHFVLLNTASGKTTLNGGGSLQCDAC